MGTPTAAPAPSAIAEQVELIQLGRILPVVQNFLHPDGRAYSHHEREAFLAAQAAASTDSTE